MLAAGAEVVACDRDPDAIAEGQALVAEAGGKLTLVHGRFGEIDRLLAERGIDAVDGITFDIGVSSMQLDQGERGFSFQKDGPLDMRMAQEGESAADWLNRSEEHTSELQSIMRISYAVFCLKKQKKNQK